jgi:hypothetical protein
LRGLNIIISALKVVSLIDATNVVPFCVMLVFPLILSRIRKAASKRMNMGNDDVMMLWMDDGWVAPFFLSI